MKPISKAKLKHFTSLTSKKLRRKHQLFMIEGKKMVNEAIQSNWKIKALVFSTDYSDQIVSENQDFSVYQVETRDFAKLSQQSNPEGVIAILHFPNEDFCKVSKLEVLPTGPGLIADGIQDPGNLGTMMRIADWFGFPYLICGSGTVDLLNAKTLRSTMGAIFRVKVIYCSNIEDLIRGNIEQIKVADMNGTTVSEVSWGPNDYILIGNEANGVSEIVKNIENLSIVSIPGGGSSESLNAAISAGILAFQLSQITKK